MANHAMNYSCQIFYISEILRAILDQITDDKRSITALAYSCKAVSCTALDYLWADMASFSPFIPLLPNSVQEIGGLGFNNAVLSLIECPPPDEWRLFDLYAYRVRRIRPREDYLDRALYQRLACIRIGVDLFPRVSSLHCHLFNPLIPGMKIFPSSLRSLFLYPEYPLVLDSRAELALRQAAQDSPQLEELYIVGIYRLHPDTGSGPLDFKRLHTVHLIANMVRATDLQSFSRLLAASPIRNLDISLRSSSEITFHPDDTGVPPTTFPSLKNIFICDGPRRAANIVSQICSPYLHSVTIDYLGRSATISEYGHFFTLLARRHPPVHSLEVRIGRIYVNTRNEYVCGFLAALEPLVYSGLARLKVEMSLYDAWKIEEDVKMKLRPEAWPTLAYFEFVLSEASMLGTFPSAHMVM